MATTLGGPDVDRRPNSTATADSGYAPPWLATTSAIFTTCAQARARRPRSGRRRPPLSSCHAPRGQGQPPGSGRRRRATITARISTAAADRGHRHAAIHTASQRPRHRRQRLPPRRRAPRPRAASARRRQPASPSSSEGRGGPATAGADRASPRRTPWRRRGEGKEEKVRGGGARVSPRTLVQNIIMQGKLTMAITF